MSQAMELKRTGSSAPAAQAGRSRQSLAIAEARDRLLESDQMSTGILAQSVPTSVWQTADSQVALRVRDYGRGYLHR